MAADRDDQELEGALYRSCEAALRLIASAGGVPSDWDALDEGAKQQLRERMAEAINAYNVTKMHEMEPIVRRMLGTRDTWGAAFERVIHLFSPFIWQAIETAPEDEPVLLYTPPERLSGDVKQKGEMIRISMARDWPHATHWLPLPDPPLPLPPLSAVLRTRGHSPAG